MTFDLVQTMALAGAALAAGHGIRHLVPWLARMNVPAPVLGGLLVHLHLQPGLAQEQRGLKRGGDNKNEVDRLGDILGRMAEHLAKNNVDISQDKITLGVPLNMNPQTEKFPGNDAANALLTRNYRAPYIVPVNV